MSVEFKAIERPPVGIGRHHGLYSALVDTVTSGQALLIPLNGRSLTTLQSRCRLAMTTRGFKFHYRANVDGTAISAWAEKKPERS